MSIDPIKPYLGLIQIGLVLAAVIAAGWWFNSFVDSQQQLGYGRAVAEYAARLAKQKEVALVTERGWRNQLEDAQRERIETEQRLAGFRTAAAIADDRLRRATSDFSQRLSAATLEAARHAAATAAELLSNCSTAYRSVAAAADGHLADLQQCEAAWPE